VQVEVEVRVLDQPMHSGSASGVVPSSFRIVRQLLDRIEDSATGRVLVPETHLPEIPPKRVEQARQVAAFLGDTIWNEFPFTKGCKPMHTDNAELLLNKTWRPTLSVVGAAGMPSVQTAGNVLRTETVLKLSVRLPPLVDPPAAIAALKATLERDPPSGAHVVFDAEAPAPGWASPILADWLEASVQRASNTFYGKPALQVGEGGSIPFMGKLSAAFPKAQFVITGVLGPGSNAHGPNEFLHIQMGKNVTACVTHIVSDFNTVKSS